MHKKGQVISSVSLVRTPAHKPIRTSLATALTPMPTGLRGGMAERGTTGAGRPQITGVPRVHRTLELDGCGARNDFLLGRTRDRRSGARPSTLRAMIHGSMVTDGAK